MHDKMMKDKSMKMHNQMMSQGGPMHDKMMNDGMMRSDMMFQTISRLPSSLSEARQHYKDSLEFGNRLLVDNFIARDNFDINTMVSKAQTHRVAPEVIEKYRTRRVALQSAKVERYRAKLASKVDFQVENYVRNLKHAIKG